MNYRKTIATAFVTLTMCAFGLPAFAGSPMTSSSLAGVQLAQETDSERTMHPEDKASGKMHEGENMATGAANAVENVHREHEANERMHRTIESKVKSKLHEGEDEVKGAGNAIEAEHQRHERAEHESGTN